MMRRAVVVLAALLALAGCGSKAPASPVTPPGGGSSTPAGSPSSTVSASPSVNPTDIVEFSVDGAGPYQIGAKLADLQSAGQIAAAGPDPNCPNNTIAQGTGTWTQVHLSFHQDGTLYALTNQSTNIPTPSGAYLGTTLADLKKIYGKVTNETLNHGSSVAFLVITISGRGIRFDLTSNLMVILMTAGDVGGLRQSFVSGAPFC